MITSEYNGIALRFDPETEMGSLTAMHEAAGKPANKSPYEWSRLPQTQEFLAALASKLNTELSRIYQTARGRDGGSWSHWQAGMEYARYLDPMLAIHWNECVMAYKTGAPVYRTPISADLLGALRDHGQRGMLLHQRLVESCDAVVCSTVDIDEHTRIFQQQIAPMLEGAKRQLEKSKEGVFYLTLPRGDDGVSERVYVKIGFSMDAPTRLESYRVGNRELEYYVKVSAIEPSKCESEMRKRIPEGWRAAGSKDHFPRMDRDFFDQMVTFLNGLNSPLTVDAIKKWRLSGMYQ